MPHQIFKITPVVLGFIAILALHGCQSYQPSPVDLRSYGQQWAEHALTDTSLVTFANELISKTSTASEFNINNGVSLQEAQLISLIFNPALKKHRIESHLPLTRNNIRALWPDPELELDIESINDGMDDDWLLSGKLGFAIPLSLRISTELDKIESQYQAEILQLLNAEQQTTQRIHDLWIALFVTTQKQQVLNSYIDELEQIIERAGESLSLDSMSATDLQSLALQAATAKTELMSLKAQHIELHIALTDTMGLKADTPLEFIFEAPTVATATPKDLWQSRLIANNTELRVSQARYQVAERHLELEIKKQYPDLLAGPIFKEGESKLGLNLSTLLPVWNRNLPAIKTARLEREAASEALKAIYQQKMNDLEGIHQKLSLLEMRERFFHEQFAPMVDQQFDNIWRAIQLGSANVLILQDALRQRLNSKLDLLDIVAARATLLNQMQTMLEPAQTDVIDLSTLPQSSIKKTDTREQQP